MIEIGAKYNLLTVISVTKDKRGQKSYECKCECGNTTFASHWQLLSGRKKSCGCLKHKRHDSYAVKHGLKNHPLYNIWRGIKKRCLCKTDIHYKWYGAKGISMYEPWVNDFKAFYDWAMSIGYQRGLSIDRIDTYGNYEPSNCRWATTKIQNNNKTVNAKYTIDGETKNFCEWCDELGMKYSTVYNRIKMGWDIKTAFTLPPKIKRKVK